jgi:long-chain fatty acid transport protein
MWRLTLGCTACILGVTAGLAPGARAAGYALKEQSVTAQGNAFAGATAGADDVSYMFFNPAALGWVDRPLAQVDASLIAPRFELKDASGSTAFGTPIGGRDRQGDVGEDAVIPTFYAAAPLVHGLTLGLGVNVPFGLETDYRDDWVGRYHGVQSTLETVNVNPALAWRPVDWLSLGAGFQAQYVYGRLTNAVDFGTVGAAAGIPGAQPGAQDGFAKLRGNDWAYGANLGAIVEPVPGTRLGVAWRSEIDHEIEGRVNFRDDDAGIAQFIRAQTGLFADTNARLDLNTPQSISFGVHQDVTPSLAVMAEAQWTDWSVFDQLTIEIDNPGQPDSVTEEEWQDTWFLALGSTYKIDQAWTLRGGVAFDQSPVREKYRTPRIPDSDRYWLSLGAGYEPTDWLGFDAAFTYILLDDSKVRLRAQDTGNGARGNLDASYEGDIFIVGLNARVRF